MVQNYKMVLQYDGSRYSGWQKQGNTGNTIQGKLEGMLSGYFGQTVEVHGSGRTDAGVHALGQTANFKIDIPEGSFGTAKADSPAGLCDKLNFLLPEDIRIVSLNEADPRFHARLNAREKEYCYYISLDKKRDVFGRRYMAVLKEPEKLDVARMESAALCLKGKHDFKGFTDGRSNKSTEREIYSINFERTNGMLGQGACLKVSFCGNGFMYHMLRLMMGTLIEVGCGNAPEELVWEILTEKDRRKVPMMAPAEGLFLCRVAY